MVLTHEMVYGPTVDRCPVGDDGRLQMWQPGAVECPRVTWSTFTHYGFGKPLMWLARFYMHCPCPASRSRLELVASEGTIVRLSDLLAMGQVDVVDFQHLDNFHNRYAQWLAVRPGQRGPVMTHIGLQVKGYVVVQWLEVPPTIDQLNELLQSS